MINLDSRILNLALPTVQDFALQGKGTHMKGNFGGLPVITLYYICP